MLGSLYDAIERLEYSFAWENNIPDRTEIIEYYFDEVTINQLQTILNDDSYISKEIDTQEYHCSDCGGRRSSVLIVTRKLSFEEKQKEIDKCLKYRKAATQFINKCLDRNPNQKADCTRILESKNLLQAINLK